MVEADRVVEADEDDDGHEGVPGQFDYDVGEHERLPAVGLARTFSDFVEGSLRDKVRHYLLHQLAEDGEQHEDGEHLIL